MASAGRNSRHGSSRPVSGSSAYTRAGNSVEPPLRSSSRPSGSQPVSDHVGLDSRYRLWLTALDRRDERHALRSAPRETLSVGRDRNPPIAFGGHGPRRAAFHVEGVGPSIRAPFRADSQKMPAVGQPAGSAQGEPAGREFLRPRRRPWGRRRSRAPPASRRTPVPAFRRERSIGRFPLPAAPRASRRARAGRPSSLFPRPRPLR